MSARAKPRMWGVEMPDPAQSGERRVRECKSADHAYQALHRLARKVQREAFVVHRAGGRWVPDPRPTDHCAPLPGPVVTRCGGQNDDAQLAGITFKGTEPR